MKTMTEQNSGCHEIRIDSWKDFDNLVEKNKRDKWLFRGQSDANWLLRTSLDRAFEENQYTIRKAGVNKKIAKKMQEVYLIKTFQQNAKRFVNELEGLPASNEILEWLALMQHYEVPTRLLDVTSSPDIATYFALTSNEKKESCVFAINMNKLEEWKPSKWKSLKGEVDYKKIIFEKDEDKYERFVGGYNSRFKNKRQKAQMGSFLVPSKTDEFYSLLRDYRDFPGDTHCIKYIIPPKLRLTGVIRLKQKEITSDKLFPGIVGFSRSLKFKLLESLG